MKQMHSQTKNKSCPTRPIKARPSRLPRLAVSLLALLPTLSYGQVSIANPAQQILQLLAAAFAIIAGIAVIFCTIAGSFGFAQWTRLLNIIGWTVAGGGGLALATWAASLAV
jgi:type IV secretory pathway VirB2 component (pilin)